MKKFARLLCVMLSVLLCIGCFSMVGCDPTNDNPPTPDKPGQTTNNSASENGTIIFSVQELDNVFNPYFTTSGYDTEITGQTQISLLASDKNGNIYCGNDEPSAALDYSQIITYGNEKYNADDKDPSKRAPQISGDPNSVDESEYYTTYEFLLKNGIRFSDGTPLTIKDVIFNLYALLDPAYYGSATVYSTAISGLARYRTQQDVDNDSSTESAINDEARFNADTRMTNLRFMYYPDRDFRNGQRGDYVETVTEDIIEKYLGDVETARAMFYDEIQSYLKGAQSELESYEDENRKAKEDPNSTVAKAAKEFTEVWEIFFYNMGMISVTETVDKDGFTIIDTYKDDTTASGHFDKYGNPHKAGDKMIDYMDTWSYFHDDASLPLIAFNNMLGIGGEEYKGSNKQYNKMVENGQLKEGGQETLQAIPNAKKPTTDIILDAQGHASTDPENCSTYKKANRDAYYKDLWTNTDVIANFYDVITFYATAGNLMDKFTGEALEEHNSSTTMNFDTIDGIRVIQYKPGDVFVGKNGEHEIEETSYVLQVKVDRVDPKALSNCGVTVAPMHYYSNATAAGQTQYAGTDYDDFNYPVYDKDGNRLTEAVKLDELSGYYTNADNLWDPNKKICPGLKYMSRDYFDKVVKSPDIISVPVGAGMYQVSSEKNTNPYYLFDYTESTKDGSKVYEPVLGSNGQPQLKGGLNGAYSNRYDFGEFDRDNVIYFIRNPFFFTTSGEIHDKTNHINARDYARNKITNCKIKMVRYQIITSTKLLDSIINGEVYYGDPTANPTNQAKIQSNKLLSAIEVKNNGYGYIGINATYVPDLEVRRAIMMALDTSLVKAYYGNSASIITRSMSTCSWASPENPDNPAADIVESSNGLYTKDYYPYNTDTTTLKNDIRNLIADAGYTGNGVKERKLADGTTHKLEYTFTIAGSTDDHPAYSTMQNAANILNDCGFKIKVKTDAQALSKLAAGTLTVWAAAWSSGSDPDMYQVYHKDSKATSVNNWGYPTIIAKKDSDDYKEQYQIIEQLSDLIDKGRETLDQEARAKTYLDALNKIMELAVEYPTYQRTNNYVYRNDKINMKTLVPDPTPFYGPLARMWEVELL